MLAYGQPGPNVCDILNAPPLRRNTRVTITTNPDQQCESILVVFFLVAFMTPMASQIQLRWQVSLFPVLRSTRSYYV